MGAYENPRINVDTQSGKNLAMMQSAVAKSFDNAMKGYANRQKEIRKENEKKELENKRTIDGINRSVTDLRRTLGIADNKYEKTNFREIYDPMILEFEKLKTAVDLGTSSNPSQDRRKMDEIYSSVKGIGDSVTNVASYVDGMDDKILNIDKQGGLFSGMDPSIFKGLSIFSQKLPGKRQPRYENATNESIGDLVWDTFDDEGKLIATFDAAKLQRIGADLDELVITIPNQTDPNKEMIEITNSVFVKDPSGKWNGEIADQFIDKQTIVNQEKTSSTKDKDTYAITYKINKFGNKGIIDDPNFNRNVDSDIDFMLALNKDQTQAVAFNNSQISKFRSPKGEVINFSQEDFVKGFENKYKIEKGKLVKQNGEEVSEEIKAALADDDGYDFTLDRPMSEEEKDIFRIAYKKHYLFTEVPNESLPSKAFVANEIVDETSSFNKNRINTLVDLVPPRPQGMGEDNSKEALEFAGKESLEAIATNVKTLNKTLGLKTGALGREGAIESQQETYNEELESKGKNNKDTKAALKKLNELKESDPYTLFIIKNDSATPVADYDPFDPASNLKVLLTYGDNLSAEEKKEIKQKIAELESGNKESAISLINKYSKNQ